jgi:(p)ppGpp synthase/HD superfamily hydrolase
VSLNAENEVSFSIRIRISNARGQRVTEIDRLGFATHWAYGEHQRTSKNIKEHQRTSLGLFSSPSAA